MPIRPIDPAKCNPAPPVTTSPSSLQPSTPGNAVRPKIVVRRVAPKVVSETPAAAPLPDSAPIIMPQPAPKRQHHKVDRTGPNWDGNGDYIIGRGRPPLRPQWKPGQSGNPRGPKKKEKLDPLAAYDEELLKIQKVRIKGEEVEMSNYQLSLTSLRSAAAKGNVRAAIRLMEEVRAAAHRQAAADGTSEAEVDAWEQEAIDTLLAELGLSALPVSRKARDVHEDGTGEQKPVPFNDADEFGDDA